MDTIATAALTTILTLIVMFGVAALIIKARSGKGP